MLSHKQTKKPLTEIIKITVLTALLAAMTLTSACNTKGGDEMNVKTDEKAEATLTPTVEPTALPKEDPVVTGDDDYVNTASAPMYVTRAVDNLGRRLVTETETTSVRSGKYVGIFYFQWLGQHGSALYDNSIISQVEGALDSEEGWISAGGGKVNEFHFWGKPMFGYYFSSDKWVIHKHIQMLTDAGVDFICFDVSNGHAYETNAIMLMKILAEYQKQGWNVPQVCFLTNTDSGATMETIYKKVYLKHPEYESLWFKWDGKPLIIGHPDEATEEMREFFRIKVSQWPMSEKNDDGFPWMEFDRLLTDDAVYGIDGRKEVVNVSLAQHNETYKMSAVSWYGSNDRSRSWHDGANDPAPDAYLYGYNFAEQFEWAISIDPEIIFITGWNEWVAQRQPASYQGPVENNGPIVFLDNASLNGSRDIEPMEGGYADNYFLQMISYIRKFKGIDASHDRNNRTIDIAGGFAQWNDIKAYYKDYEGDTVNRKSGGWGNIRYTDASGRNDFTEFKVCEDDDNVYFFVKTAEDITEPQGDNWMNLFIGSPDSTLSDSWYGYNFVLNYSAPSSGSTLLLGKLTPGSDRYEVNALAEVPYRLSGNMMMVSIPKALLGFEAGSGTAGNVSIVFKWADNCTVGDVDAFYTTGDAAPIGRSGFYYGP